VVNKVFLLRCYSALAQSWFTDFTLPKQPLSLGCLFFWPKPTIETSARFGVGQLLFLRGKRQFGV